MADIERLKEMQEKLWGEIGRIINIILISAFTVALSLGLGLWYFFINGKVMFPPDTNSFASVVINFAFFSASITFVSVLIYKITCPKKHGLLQHLIEEEQRKNGSS